MTAPSYGSRSSTRAERMPRGIWVATTTSLQPRNIRKASANVESYPKSKYVVYTNRPQNGCVVAKLFALLTPVETYSRLLRLRLDRHRRRRRRGRRLLREVEVLSPVPNGRHVPRLGRPIRTRVRPQVLVGLGFRV